MAKKKAQKKTQKKLESGMVFHNLTLNEQDLQHLRWVLSCDVEMQQHLMNSPPTTGQSPEEILEDWVIARDLMADSMKIIQMIDKLFPGGGQK
jgi:hypothetical protein